MTTRSTTAFLLLGSALAAAGPARAAGRVVVLPVVIGAGNGATADGTAALMPPLAEGLAANPRWEVVSGPGTKSLIAGTGGAPATVADWDRLSGLLDRAAAQIGKGAPADAMAAAEAAAEEIQRAFRAGPWSPRAADVAFRSGALLAAALQAGGEAERAKKAAGDTSLAFHGRSASERDGVSSEAAALLSAPATPSAALTVNTRPDTCDVFLNGQKVGRGHVEAEAAADGIYWAWAECSDGMRTSPRRLNPSSQASARTELLDADFARALDCSGADCRLRFGSPAERRTLEESYARRAAEAFDAGAVVFASVGQLGGQDWLNARLYLASGFQVRQGLARLEAQRARALGTYLATGKEAAGVLKPDDATALALAAQGQGEGPPAELRPWYTDYLGWSLGGAGALGLAGGFVLRGQAHDKSAESDAIRGDPERRDTLARESESLKFESFLLLGVGATLVVTGIIMLALPEEETRSQLVLAPTQGGGAVSFTARF